MSKDVHNEYIQLLGRKVLNKIVKQIQEDRYYLLILDCTPDINHEEQMTMTIRHVHVSGSDVTVFEHFTGFIHVKSSTASSLTESVLQKLNELGLDISNCKGQGYDNGANMAGKKNGLQNKILQLNPQARFVPCSCHSLNLV